MNNHHAIGVHDDASKIEVVCDFVAIVKGQNSCVNWKMCIEAYLLIFVHSAPLIILRQQAK